MDIMDVLNARPSTVVSDPPGAARAGYLMADGTTTPAIDPDAAPRPPARGDTAMTAGALALLALAGLVGMRYAFKGALP